MLLTTAARS